MDLPLLYTNQNRDQVLEFLQTNAFGILVSPGQDYPEASHLPYTIEEVGGQWYLHSHMGSTNRHKALLESGSGHLFIVQGTDHYISSTWYDHENVPTWNYISVHLTGTVEVQEGEEALRNIKELMDRLESPENSHRSMEKLDPDMIHREMRGLVAFRMKIEKVEAARKLSQNRDKNNYDNIIRELIKLDSGSSRDMAEAMRNNYQF